MVPLPGAQPGAQNARKRLKMGELGICPTYLCVFLAVDILKCLYNRLIPLYNSIDKIYMVNPMVTTVFNT